MDEHLLDGLLGNLGKDFRPSGFQKLLAKHPKIYEPSLKSPMLPAKGTARELELVLLRLFGLYSSIQRDLLGVPRRLADITSRLDAHRIIYMLGHCNKTEWKQNIFNLHRKSQRLILLRDLLRLFVDIFNDVYDHLESREITPTVAVEKIIRSIHFINSEHIRLGAQVAKDGFPLITHKLAIYKPGFGELYYTPSNEISDIDNPPTPRIGVEFVGNEIPQGMFDVEVTTLVQFREMLGFRQPQHWGDFQELFEGMLPRDGVLPAGIDGDAHLQGILDAMAGFAEDGLQ